MKYWFFVCLLYKPVLGSLRVLNTKKKKIKLIVCGCVDQSHNLISINENSGQKSIQNNLTDNYCISIQLIN